MKIIFFGLGSAGNRHAKILADNFNHELFAYRSNKGKGRNPLNIKEIDSWSKVKKISPDVAFITNPTFLHVDLAIKCARLNMKLFIEKPIDCSIKNLDLLLDEANKRNLVTYVAYNLRFHPVIKYLKKYVIAKKIYHVNIYNSSYLPKWKPNQNHMSSYSVLREKGGGVILDLSHEFDYINYLFGGIEKINGIFDKASCITKDVEDFLDAIIKTKSAYVNLHLNFLSMHTERTIKIDCEDEYIYADLIKNRIEIYKNRDVKVLLYESDMNETYKKQIEFFLQNIDNERMMNNLFEAEGLFRQILGFRKG